MPRASLLYIHAKHLYRGTLVRRHTPKRAVCALYTSGRVVHAVLALVLVSEGSNSPSSQKLG